jgi:serine/threonine protein kinase
MWIVMELMIGDLDLTFLDLAKDEECGCQKLYTENMCKYLLRECLTAIEFLHSKCVIHRDIRARNLLINLKGDVKLADFGCAVQNTVEKFTHEKSAGTLHWLAPEMATNENEYGVSVDIWSFGILSHEIGSKSYPFSDKSEEIEVRNAIVDDEMPKLEHPFGG